MAFGITSDDLVAICIVLAKGDTSLSIADVINRAEKFQDQVGRHFGVSEDDFKAAFFWLGYEHNLYDLSAFDSGEQGPPEFSNPLSEWIPLILDFYDVYFNDEGESWSRHETFSRFDPDGYTDFRNLVASFLEDIRDVTPEMRLEYLKQYGWEESTLKDYMEGSLCHPYSDNYRYPPNCIISRLGVRLHEAADSSD